MISILLEKYSLPELAEKIVFIAGHKVTNDPVAIPFSMVRHSNSNHMISWQSRFQQIFHHPCIGIISFTVFDFIFLGMISFFISFSLYFLALDFISISGSQSLVHTFQETHQKSSRRLSNEVSTESRHYEGESILPWQNKVSTFLLKKTQME